MRDIVISLGAKENLAAITKVVKTTWPKFVEFLTRAPMKTQDKAKPGWYCPAHFEPAYRDGKNLVARHCLTFDYDEIDEWDLEEIRDAYKDVAHILYTTASHTPEKPRLRAVFPLSRPVTAEEFGAVTRKVAAMCDIEKLARESDKPAQMMFLPSVRKGGEFWSEVTDGKWVDVDGVLEEYDDWTDRKEWPKRLQGDSAYIAGDDIPAPDTKPGIVGQFCRAFSIPDVIDRFKLPYVSGSSEERWTYTFGSRPDGFRIYDGGLKGHSDHNTDPAHGQHNAFDLVRLHLFGNQDTGDDAEKPITERPSYKAMCQLALEQKEVQAQRVLNEFENLDAENHVGISADNAENPTRPKFTVVPAPDFASDVSMEWLIKSVLPKAELVVMYGQSGSGKSFLALDLCAAISRGLEWRGHRSVPGQVVYVCAEGAGGFRQRLRAYAVQHNIQLNEFGVIGDTPNLLDVEDVAGVAQAIIAFGKADLVVIDTLSASIPGADENAGKDLGKVVEHCRFIHKKTGALVMLIHHSGKDASRGARGWSGLRAAADAEIEITRNGDFRTASVTKMKDGSDGRQWSFKLRTVVLGIDTDGEEITSCVIEHVDSPEQPMKNRVEPTGLYPKTALTVARRLLKGGEPMAVDEVISAAVASLPEVEKGKRDTRKQQISRAVQKLVTDQWLFLHKGNKVSLTTAIAAEEEDWL